MLNVCLTVRTIGLKFSRIIVFPFTFLLTFWSPLSLSPQRLCLAALAAVIHFLLLEPY